MSARYRVGDRVVYGSLGVSGRVWSVALIRSKDGATVLRHDYLVQFDQEVAVTGWDGHPIDYTTFWVTEESLWTIGEIMEREG